MREGEEVVVEAEREGGDDEVPGDEQVAKHGPYGRERQGFVERDVPGVLPARERRGPREEQVCLGVGGPMLEHAARRNVLAAVGVAKVPGLGAGEEASGRAGGEGPRDKVGLRGRGRGQVREDEFGARSEVR